ncbi:MAG TPA: hypothetical protein VJY66_01775 [Acholeplasma sp.]|nr:hypothetical protein [Acholeplasma sp.]
MIYNYINNNSPHTLIMLHGTGGNEIEMSQFGKKINPHFNILSLRGNVSEGGMNRFFKRLGMGIYDLDSYVSETRNLNNAIIKYSNQFNFELGKSFVIGFSNGANIALGLIQEYPTLLSTYILLSPDYINKNKGFKNLTNMNILISSSRNDPYTSYDAILKLENNLKEKGALVSTFEVPGHVITNELLSEVQLFVKAHRIL